VKLAVVEKLLVLILSAGCVAGDSPAPEPAPATTRPSAPATRPGTRAPTTYASSQPRNDIPGLPNFAKVSDSLYRGAQPTAEGFDRLKRMGVKTVVNLRSFSSDRSDLKGTGLRYAHIYCKAWHPEDEDTLDFLKIMSDPANHPVFVHCQKGADRTGCVVAVYRVVEQGWSMEDAVKEMHQFGFHPVWTEISKYLKRFDAAKVRKKVARTRMPEIDVVE
jgi:protein tyrosine/serine phosphatase